MSWDYVYLHLINDFFMSKKGRSFLTKRQTLITADESTGEITSETVIENVISRGPGAFLRLFLTGISAFIPLTNAEKNVLIIGAAHAGVKDNRVDFSSKVTEEIRLRTGMHDVTRRQAISSLVKKGFLFPVSRGSYIIDPGIMFRGSDRDMINTLSLNVKFRVGVDGLGDNDIAEIFGNTNLDGVVVPKKRRTRL